VPSPIGHALAGVAIGWSVCPGECREAGLSAVSGLRGLARRFRWPLGFAFAASAADLDLLVNLHSRYTHSVGAVLLAWGVAWVACRRRGLRRPAAASLAVALAYASHVVLDFLGSDTTPPFGIMALWPFSSEFYLAPVAVFMGISRKYWLAAAWRQDALSVARELLFLLPLAALALWWRGLPLPGPTDVQELQRFREPPDGRRKSTNQ
jgi:membrane-bound metal-dependent hydrolase YbcI (DUF457 family)